MDLKTYIAEVGDEAAAKQFDVKPRTAKSWRLGARKPKPTQVPKIIEATGGKVTWEGVYGVPTKAA